LREKERSERSDRERQRERETGKERQSREGTEKSEWVRASERERRGILTGGAGKMKEPPSLQRYLSLLSQGTHTHKHRTRTQTYKPKGGKTALMLHSTKGVTDAFVLGLHRVLQCTPTEWTHTNIHNKDTSKRTHQHTQHEQHENKHGPPTGDATSWRPKPKAKKSKASKKKWNGPKYLIRPLATPDVAISFKHFERAAKSAPCSTVSGKRTRRRKGGGKEEEEEEEEEERKRSVRRRFGVSESRIWCP
jgi:hypothetical protein